MNSLSGHHGSLFLLIMANALEAEVISPDKTPDLPNFAETFARQSSWEMEFGQAPAFCICWNVFSPGGVELHFDVEKGHITRTQVFTDSLNPAPLEALAERLAGPVSRRCFTADLRSAGYGISGSGKRAA